jgi:hypothetical protein
MTDECFLSLSFSSYPSSSTQSKEVLAYVSNGPWFGEDENTIELFLAK